MASLAQETYLTHLLRLQTQGRAVVALEVMAHLMQVMVVLAVLA
jgi:hypothetical protein